ncbi:activator of HSP90 ATPase [Asanoa sp. NPDC050611]|uniref:SRPBCC family protein n=1 Tax=Asanoa sp. NPDC050611 TaxID=3157098 RepID=UPI0033E62C06
MEPFRVETTVDAPTATVRPHFVEPELIRQWFGWDYPGLDDEIKMIFVDGAEAAAPDRIDLGADQTITFTEAGPDRTLVRIESPGIPADQLDMIAEGWRQFLEQLRFVLDRGVSGRRTVYLDGRGAPATLAAGLGDGSAWHRSRFQRITVDDAGHLVALVTQAPVDSTEPADAMATVSTFGLDDTAFAAVADEWARRWKSLTA